MKFKRLITIVWFLCIGVILIGQKSTGQEQQATEPPVDAQKTFSPRFVKKISAFSEDLLKFKAHNYLDFDEEHNLIYGRERSKITHGKYILEADKIIIDLRLNEAQAYGNVVLTSPKDTIRAESLIYNFGKETGTANNVSGHHGDLYFHGPSFKKLSRSTI